MRNSEHRGIYSAKAAGREYRTFATNVASILTRAWRVKLCIRERNPVARQQREGKWRRYADEKPALLKRIDRIRAGAVGLVHFSAKSQK